MPRYERVGSGTLWQCLSLISSRIHGPPRRTRQDRDSLVTFEGSPKLKPTLVIRLIIGRVFKTLWYKRASPQYHPSPHQPTSLCNEPAMNTNSDLHRRIQRGPPNVFNLPDMFREIAHSLRRSFRRAHARRRQHTSSVPNVLAHTTPHY